MGTWAGPGRFFHESSQVGHDEWWTCALQRETSRHVFWPHAAVSESGGKIALERGRHTRALCECKKGSFFIFVLLSAWRLRSQHFLSSHCDGKLCHHFFFSIYFLMIKKATRCVCRGKQRKPVAQWAHLHLSTLQEVFDIVIKQFRFFSKAAAKPKRKGTALLILHY